MPICRSLHFKSSFDSGSGKTHSSNRSSIIGEGKQSHFSLDEDEDEDEDGSVALEEEIRELIVLDVASDLNWLNEESFHSSPRTTEKQREMLELNIG